MDDYSKQLTEISVKLVEQNISKICKCILSLGSDVINSSKIGNGEAFIKYLETSIEKYSKVKTILYKLSPVCLYDFYVNLDLSCGTRVYNTKNVSDIFDKYKFLIITASGGAGKSTLLKHLFLNTIENTDKIPIFIELKDINNTSYTIKDCIYNTLTTLKFDLEQKYFYKALESGCFVLFFDGFDEIQDDKKNSVAKEIIDLSDRYDENYYVVSSRLSDRFIGWNKFTEMRVLPLDKAKALEMIEKIKYDSKVKDKFLAELDKKLYEEHKSFASNPLLLTIMLMTFDQYAKIPEKIHLFYQQAFETLYSKHDATKGVFTREMGTNLASDDFAKILSIFCTLSYLEGKTTFSHENLMNYLDSAKKIENIQFNTDDYKKDLIDSVCVLVQDGLNYIFTHRSFQEYFTAKFISSCSDEQQKKLLYEIFSCKPSSINEDIIFDILFDINKESLERNFVIPTLKELRRLTKANSAEEQYFAYLKLIYTDIGLDKLEDVEEESIFYTVNHKTTKYKHLVSFIRRKYLGYSEPSLSISLNEEFDYKEFIRKNSNAFNFIDIMIPFDAVKTQSETFYRILEVSYDYIKDFQYSLNMLDILKKEHKDKKSARDFLFNSLSNNNSVKWLG